MDKRNLKGQSAMEFMIIVFLLLFIFVIITSVLATNVVEMNKKKTAVNGEDLTIKVQKEINLAARVRDGYKREFTIPQKIINTDYNISIQNNSNSYIVIINIEGQDFWRKIPGVIGNINIGSNTIKKTNGTIYLN